MDENYLSYRSTDGNFRRINWLRIFTITPTSLAANRTTFEQTNLDVHRAAQDKNAIKSKKLGLLVQYTLTDTSNQILISVFKNYMNPIENEWHNWFTCNIRCIPVSLEVLLPEIYSYYLLDGTNASAK